MRARGNPKNGPASPYDMGMNWLLPLLVGLVGCGGDPAELLDGWYVASFTPDTGDCAGFVEGPARFEDGGMVDGPCSLDLTDEDPPHLAAYDCPMRETGVLSSLEGEVSIDDSGLEATGRVEVIRESPDIRAACFGFLNMRLVRCGEGASAPVRCEDLADAAYFDVAQANPE